MIFIHGEFTCLCDLIPDYVRFSPVHKDLLECLLVTLKRYLVLISLTISSWVHTYVIVSSIFERIRINIARLASSSSKLLPCFALIGGPLVCIVRKLAYFHCSTLTLFLYAFSIGIRGTPSEWVLTGSGLSGFRGEEVCDEEMPSWFT